MYVNGRNLCIGCMRPLDSEGGCSFCGLIQENYSPIPRCLSPGTELAGRYVTGKVLGEGSFGITYMGWDKRLDIPVAVKEYFPSDMVSRDVICGLNNSVYLYENENKGEYREYLKKFWNEAKCLSRFNQVDGIVSVLDFFYENNTAYIVMQYIDGISVKQYVRENGKLDAKQVLEMMHPVLLALEKVHDTGIVHRDINPDNIMMKKDGSLVLIDFGAARMRNIDYTKTMTVMFKRGFSPEEQYRLKGKWGPYTDVYSISAVMYFMMTGYTPLDAVVRVLGDDMPSLVSMKDLTIPVRQRKAVMKGLGVNVKNRWRTVRELCGALYEEEEGVQGRRGDRERRRKMAVGGIVAVPLAGFALTCAWNFGGVGNAVPGWRTEAVMAGAFAEGSGRYLPVVNGGAVQAGQAVGDLIRLSKMSEEDEQTSVPQLIGLDTVAAKEKLRKRGLTYKVRKRVSNEERGTVVRQSIRSGKKVDGGTCVTLTVSKGRKKPTPAPAPGMGGDGSSTARGGGSSAAREDGSSKNQDNDFVGVIK